MGATEAINIAGGTEGRPKPNSVAHQVSEFESSETRQTPGTINTLLR